MFRKATEMKKRSRSYEIHNRKSFRLIGHKLKRKWGIEIGPFQETVGGYIVKKGLAECQY